MWILCCSRAKVYILQIDCRGSSFGWGMDGRPFSGGMTLFIRNLCAQSSLTTSIQLEHEKIPGSSTESQFLERNTQSKIKITCAQQFPNHQFSAERNNKFVWHFTIRNLGNTKKIQAKTTTKAPKIQIGRIIAIAQSPDCSYYKANCISFGGNVKRWKRADVPKWNETNKHVYFVLGETHINTRTHTQTREHTLKSGNKRN